MTVSILESGEVAEYVRQRPRSQEEHKRAGRILSSGIANDVRAARPFPIAIARGSGARKWDVDGNEYIDFHLGSAALLLGHAHPDVVAAVREQLERSTHYAQAHPMENEWGEWIQRLMPSIERLRFTSSGTEANMLALRLARAYTGEPRVLRFEGHYHGWLPVGVLGQRPPFAPLASGGIPQNETSNYVAIPANDPELVARTLDADPQIGSVILEPSGGSWSTIPLRPGFLQAVREVTAARGVVLIFDEVITGFRWSSGGAQVRFGITPDLTTMAKIVSGGMPGGAVGGRADIMAGLVGPDPKRRVAQGGTFNGNPLSAAAGIATLRIASTGEPQRHADALAERLRAGINEIIKRVDISAVAYGESSTFHIYIGERPAGVSAGEHLWTDDAARLKGMPQELVDGLRRALQNVGVDLMSGTGGMVSAVSGARVAAT